MCTGAESGSAPTSTDPERSSRAVIRNAVLHLLNEQPLLADLLRMPEPADSGLVCTNLRMMNGKRPVFVDDSASTFFFPYRQMRFIEIPGGRPPLELSAPATEAAPAAGPPGAVPTAVTPAVSPAGSGEEPPVERDLELDEELLRRVREI